MVQSLLECMGSLVVGRLPLAYKPLLGFRPLVGLGLQLELRSLVGLGLRLWSLMVVLGFLLCMVWPPLWMVWLILRMEQLWSPLCWQQPQQRMGAHIAHRHNAVALTRRTRNCASRWC